MGAHRSVGNDANRADPTWKDDAACADRGLTWLFFVRDAERVHTIETEVNKVRAKSICMNECPVREPCLEYALAAGEKDGIWGGYDETELRALRRRAKSLDQQVAAASA